MRLKDMKDRADIVAYLDYCSTYTGDNIFRDFREYWSPKGPDYGLSRCMPWGAFSLISYNNIIGGIFVTSTPNFELYKDHVNNVYVKYFDRYYKFVWDFKSYPEELHYYIYNALIITLTSGVFKLSTDEYRKTIIRR